MRRLSICRYAVIGALLAASGQAQSTTDTIYHLHGAVVNGATGRPIGRALVVSADRRLATMTNSEGQFTLDVSVPAAQAAAQTGTSQPTTSGGPGGITLYGSTSGTLGSSVVLMAQRPGFLRSRGGVNVALDSTASTRNVVLRLMPSASIRGSVSVSGAESFRGLRVQLLRYSAQDGRPGWQFAGAHPVAEDGTFHFIDLQPGDYTLATSEWSPGGFNSSAAVTQQYSPVFLGGTATLDVATKLHLVAGQSVPANLHLRAVPYYSISIPVQGLPPNANANVTVASGVGVPLYQLGWNARNSAVEGALPDGNYTISITEFAAQRSAAQVPLHVAGAPVVHAPVGLTPLQSIQVLVRDERTNVGSNGSATVTSIARDSTPGATPGFFLSARNEEPMMGSMATMENTPEGPMLRNVVPGRYYLQGAEMGQGYIASLTCDGVDLLTNALVVNDSGHTAPIQVTLRDDAGTVSGTVDLNTAGVQAARIFILPTDGSGHVVYGFAAGTGRFEVSNVPPGSYRVLAVPADRPDTLPYRDPQAMRPFASRGGAVTVMAGQTAQVQAELVGADGTDLP
ncbi:carboxypeptidase-like regulatory domain-containing protein [Terriglobus aquaticus]|uniref:carboxypeptidase-like regulatory domain-containing protein n=1 Tax=Terriglobus aquaticus TaxID=940139 RepID=UPI0021DF74B4|nr:carboxypeptidase-like regulatory domain-containing protein [Terriglobus aquaticus]